VTADGSTAAVSPSAVTAWVGLDHLSDSDTTPGSASNLIVVHPDYDPVSLDNDVALVMLTDLSDHEPVALGGPADPAVGSVPAVLGWGITDSVTQVLSDTLLRVAAPILAPGRCSALEPGYDATSKICAGGALGQDSCSGDSGGPLVLAAGTGLASLVGTVDYGSQTCGDGQPSVYQRITSGSVQPFLRFWTAMPRIESTSGNPIAGQPLTLQVTDGALFGTVDHTWDLDADGQFDDATGDAVTLPLDTSWRSVAVRATDGNGDVGKQRITIIPGAPPLGGVGVIVPPKNAGEDSVLRLPLWHTGAVGTIRATFSQPGFAPVTVTSATDATTLSIPIPGDRAWSPSRTGTLTLSAQNARLLTAASYTVRVFDDDTPRIGLTGVKRRGAREILVPIKVPGPGTVKVTLMSATSDHTLLRKKLTIGGTTRKVVLRVTRKVQKLLSKARPRIKVTWISSVSSEGYVVRTVRGPRLPRP
jgi:trypsin